MRLKDEAQLLGRETHDWKFKEPEHLLGRELTLQERHCINLADDLIAKAEEHRRLAETKSNREKKAKRTSA